MPETAQDSGQPSATQDTKPSTQQSDAAATTATTTQVDGAAQTAKPTATATQDDRSKWIPPHRFNEVSQKNRQFEADLAALKTQLAERDRKLAILATGADPNQAGEDQKRGEIRSRILETLGISEDQLQSVLKAPQYLEQSQRAEQQRWVTFGDRQIDALSGRIAESIGLEGLDDDQKFDVRLSFKRWIETKAQQEIDQTGDSKTVTRYERGDDTLLNEFADSYTKRWVDPARRQATAQTTQRIRPVVSSQGRNAPTTTKRPETFKSLDERLDFAGQLLHDQGYFQNR